MARLFFNGLLRARFGRSLLGAVARVSIRREFTACAFGRSEDGLNSVRNFRRIFPLRRVGLLTRK
jgi:hypothetical protein